MKCPCCGAAELVHDIRDLAFRYRNQATVIPEVEGDYCPACGEVILDAANGDRFTLLAQAFENEVNETWGRVLTG